jgi:2-dehydropantoate 2-reductase
MLQDLEAGKELELDAILAAVVEIADLTGAPAPTLRTVYAATDLLSRSVTKQAATPAMAPA